MTDYIPLENFQVIANYWAVALTIMMISMLLVVHWQYKYFQNIIKEKNNTIKKYKNYILEQKEEIEQIKEGLTYDENK